MKIQKGVGFSVIGKDVGTDFEMMLSLQHRDIDFWKVDKETSFNKKLNAFMCY